MENPPSQKRVVVTGMGVVASLGHNVNDFWAGIVAGKCGIDKVSLFDAKDYSCQIGAEVVKKGRLRSDLFLVNIQLVNDDFFDALFDGFLVSHEIKIGSKNFCERGHITMPPSTVKTCPVM